MTFFPVFLVGALMSFTSAAPTSHHNGTFSVTQVRNPQYVRNGPAALAKTYLKYGKTLPEGLAAIMANFTLARRDAATGSATTTPEKYDSEYLTPVSIGTPAQKLNLDFDTGSSDLWVFSSLTPSNEIDGQSIYTPGSSSSSKQVSDATWSISYGDGSSSSGVVYTDIVNVGGVSFSSQAVEAAKKVSSSFTSDSSNDGLLGLAFSSINTVSPTKQNTFFANIQSSLTSQVFTADLKAGSPGKYNFGYIENSAYTGSITYSDVNNSNGFWGITASGYGIGSSSFTSTSFSAIADTGTTLALLPTDIVTAYYNQVSGSQNSKDAGGYIFDCSATLPDFTYGIGDARITVPGKYINFSPYQDNSCFGGIQDDTSIGISILGDVALKAAFVVFDATPKLGFATKNLS